MHALLLGPRGESHGNVLDGPPEPRGEMSLEMGEDDEAVRSLRQGRHLDRLEMLVPGRDVDDVAAVQAIGNDHGAAEELLGEPVGRCGLQRVLPLAAATGIEHRGVEDERRTAARRQPAHDLAGIDRIEKAVVPLLPPVELDAHRGALAEWRIKPRQKSFQYIDGTLPGAVRGGEVHAHRMFSRS